MSERKPITEAEYLAAMKEKERIEKYLEHLTRITRDYVYQWEAERVVARRLKSQQQNQTAQR